MSQRIHIGAVAAHGRPLQPGDTFDLDPAAARHVQVLRLQPGDELVLFTGEGGEWLAHVATMGRSQVGVTLAQWCDVDRELEAAVTLAVGMPANERMDSLIEKATELGAACIQPLECERSVLRLAGERAARRVQHWQAIAIAACEQSGRTRVPLIAPVRRLSDWLSLVADAAPLARRIVLAPAAQHSFAAALRDTPAAAYSVLSGPEGGLAPAELESALRAGFTACGLGPRVLRADTAPLAAMSLVSGYFGGDKLKISEHSV